LTRRFDLWWPGDSCRLREAVDIVEVEEAAPVFGWLDGVSGGVGVLGSRRTSRIRVLTVSGRTVHRAATLIWGRPCATGRRATCAALRDADRAAGLRPHAHEHRAVLGQPPGSAGPFHALVPRRPPRRGARVLRRFTLTGHRQRKRLRPGAGGQDTATLVDAARSLAGGVRTEPTLFQQRSDGPA
jgi:hypothetical protein